MSNFGRNVVHGGIIYAAIRDGQVQEALYAGDTARAEAILAADLRRQHRGRVFIRHMLVWIPCMILLPAYGLGLIIPAIFYGRKIVTRIRANRASRESQTY